MASAAQSELQRLEALNLESPAFIELQRLEALRLEDVDVSPFEVPAPTVRPITSGQRLERRTTDVIDPFSTQERAAAEAGVDILTGAPTGRATAGFAGNQAQQAEFLRKELTEFFGQPVRLRQGPESGELEFFNPETNRFTTVDEATVTSRDLADFLSDAPVLIGAGIGEIVGGIPGAAVGAAGGELVKQGIGNILDVGKGLEESFISAGEEAALAGGGSLLARGVGAAARGVRNIVSPRPVSGEVAEAALDAAATNQAIADEISRVSQQPFRPFTGQLSGEETLLGAQAALRTGPETAAALRQRIGENETALEAFFDETVPQGAVQSAVGREVQATARARTQRFIDQGDEIAQTSVNNLENLIESLPRRGADESGRRIRDLVVVERRALKALETDAYSVAELQYGLNPETGLSSIKIPASRDLERTMRALSAEQKEALFAEQAAGKSILTPASLTEATTLDLHQVQEAIRFLRRRKRLDARGEVAATPAGRDVTRVLDSLVKMRSQFLAETNPDVLDAIETAEQLTRDRVRLFDRGALRSLLKKDESGEFVLRDREVIARTIATGDKDAVQHLMDILSENPAGQQELQKTMLAFYRNEVVSDGLPNSALHRRFVERHGEALEVIFPKQPGKIKRFGDTIRTGEEIIARTEKFKDQVAKTFRGRLQDVSPENVVKDMFARRFSVKDANRFRQMAKISGFLPQYQRAVGDEVRRRVFTNDVLSPTKLGKFLSDQDEVLKGLMGPQYVKDLNTLLSGLQIVRTQPGGIARTAGNSLLDLMRVLVAPPLSQRGRAQTLFQNINFRGVQRAMLDAVLDPKKLRQLVLQRNSDITSKRVLGLLGALGGASINRGDQPPPAPVELVEQ